MIAQRIMLPDGQSLADFDNRHSTTRVGSNPRRESLYQSSRQPGNISNQRTSVSISQSVSDGESSGLWVSHPPAQNNTVLQLKSSLIEQATARLRRRLLEEDLLGVVNQVDDLQSQLDTLRAEAAATLDAVKKTKDQPADDSGLDSNMSGQDYQMKIFESRAEMFKTSLTILKTNQHVKDSDEPIKMTPSTSFTSTLSKMSSLFSRAKRRLSVAASQSEAEDDVPRMQQPAEEETMIACDPMAADDEAQQRRHRRRRRVRHCRERYLELMQSYDQDLEQSESQANEQRLTEDIASESLSFSGHASQDIEAEYLRLLAANVPATPYSDSSSIVSDSLLDQIGQNYPKSYPVALSVVSSTLTDVTPSSSLLLPLPLPSPLPLTIPPPISMAPFLPFTETTDPNLDHWLSEQEAQHIYSSPLNIYPPTPNALNNNYSNNNNNNNNNNIQAPERNAFDETLSYLDHPSFNAYDINLLEDLYEIVNDPTLSPTPEEPLKDKPFFDQSHVLQWLQLLLPSWLVLTAQAGWKWYKFFNVLGLALIISLFNGPDEFNSPSFKSDQ
ncbi:hypothetical protein J3Q64DRAFT_1828679 [Phycomyces blakesleeanus]|uniref:Uncharacterized protein n=2 Tax=Phycomyces blakesleeanus TaxID=4837 RepID=A0A162V0E2_PHYB8|nr:hypothetical protein PHYBLDRAFT_58210 [Phycomyces blakesleeanus NRRL 1555(-)]OAD79163.1 hypothetical protein PHYBLDRAFT_58210 [Phycomyces blakesleeanus NRRL 1555(-)]|eukprot:XP_018297203.1 hypothetical protein PHYBLDRAFT_58210 [Phycomyces blakesleeanus NRRL 1555(-)]